MKKLSNEKRAKLNTIVLAAGFLAYACFNLFLTVRHQPYRDEANVWLMAKYLSPVTLLKEIHYQGHPCLWYFLVMPFAKAGFPYRTIEVISFLVMMAATGLFLWKANVSTVVKLFFMASPFCVYFYPVIARNYCLIALLMMLCAWLHPEKNEKPLLYGLILGLLVQADTIAIGTAGALSFAWLCEAAVKSIKQKRWSSVLTAAKGLWIPLVSLGLWALQMRGVSDCQAYEIKWQGMGALVHGIKDYSLRIIARLTGWNELQIILFALIFLGACVWLSRLAGTAEPLFVMLASYLFQVVFSVVVYELHIWHFLSLGFVMMWMMWVLGERQRQADGWSRSRQAVISAADLNLMVILLAVGMIVHWNSAEESSNLDRALHMPYSDGYQAACFVKENIPQDAPVITTDVAMSSSVRVYLDGYEFYYAGSGQPVTYATWSEEQLRTISAEELDTWVRETFAGQQAYYVILTSPSCLEDDELPGAYEPVYRTPQKTSKNESYEIYRIAL